MEKTFEDSDIAKKLANYRLPRFEDLIKFDIFMNQLIAILDEYLSIFLVPDEAKYLTPSMINNYVFKQVVEPPVQKKYSKYHIVYLLVIGILKQVMSLSDITTLLQMQTKQYTIETAYDYFCTELEKAMHVVFEERDFAQIERTQPTKTTPLTKTVRSAVLAFANHIYVKQSIYFNKTNNN